MKIQSKDKSAHFGMTAEQANRLEKIIIGGCVLAMVFIFQPFNQILFMVGCIGVVVGGLAFNLVPLCVSGKSGADIARGAVIILGIFFTVVIFALLSAWGYGQYLKIQ